MGQKVNPNGFRFGINRNWQSRWIATSKAQTAKWIIDDYKVRKLLYNGQRAAYVDRVEIERTKERYDIFLYVMNPILVAGPEDAKLPALAKEVNKIVGRTVKVSFNVIAVNKPELSATIVAREIADAIENRVSFRTAQKQALKKVMRAGAKGIRTSVSGRLGGAEIAREEGYSEGQTPLTTLRSDVDYALAEASTPYGQIGCKVWINRGEIFEPGKEPHRPETSTAPTGSMQGAR